MATDIPPVSPAALKMTPMLRQYLEIKAQHPGTILFYRMGDFYEMFFEDAEIASKTLGITLTSRSREDENQVPMCGVPHHAVASYLSKMVKAGFRVAVCEQVAEAAGCWPEFPRCLHRQFPHQRAALERWPLRAKAAPTYPNRKQPSIKVGASLLLG